MVNIKRIDISIFPCVICSQLLLLCFAEVVGVNAFLNDQINMFRRERLKCYFFCIDNFYFLCILITCEEQAFHYSDKV